MTQAAIPAPSPGTLPLTPAPATARQHLLNNWLMIAFSVALAAAALADYRAFQISPSMKVQCLIAGIAAGVGMVFTLGGAMHYGDLLLATRPAWYWRWLLITQRRLLMLAQLAATALFLAILAAMIFDLKIPTPDYSMYLPSDP